MGGEGGVGGKGGRIKEREGEGKRMRKLVFELYTPLPHS